MSNNKSNINERYDWLDIIKAICIITVVIFHINYASNISKINSVYNYLKSIAGLYEVTIFYCIAGITLNNNKLKNSFAFLQHKFKKLYLKAIIIGLFAVLFHNMLINIGFYKLGFSYHGKTMFMYNINDYISNIIKTLLLANREVILGAFWFVWGLIICFIMLTIIEFFINKIKFIKKKREFRLLITFLLMVFSIVASNYFGITIPRFSNSLVGMFLIDFTNYIYDNNKMVNINFYGIISCIIIVLVAPCFGKIVMNDNNITSPYFLLAVVYSSLYLLFAISKKIEKNKCLKFLKYIGKNSFSIMAFHFFGFKVGGLFLKVTGINVDIGLLNPNAQNLFLLIYYVLFGILFSIIVSQVLKKIFNFEL